MVTEQELTDYLGADTPADAGRRELAHRELMIQKLRESVVRAEVHVEDTQVDAAIADVMKRLESWKPIQRKTAPAPATLGR